MQSTTNYAFPLYESTDVPDLVTGYDAAMNAIDGQIKINANAIAAINQFNPDPTNDDDFTVDMLAGAKVTASGIVYIPPTTPNNNL